MAGFEPTTSRLLSGCSTAKLHWRVSSGTEINSGILGETTKPCKFCETYFVAGLNRRPPACEAGVIATRPTKLVLGMHSRVRDRSMPIATGRCINTPARTRTWNLRLRRATPYPLGHRGDLWSMRHSSNKIDAFQSHFSQARLAQSVERKALNLVVVGSSPTVGELLCTSKMFHAGLEPATFGS